MSPDFQLAAPNDGTSHGTALWPAGRCLAHFLPVAFPAPHRTIELGSGIGLTALALASNAWPVIATDTAHVLNAVLRSNVANNRALLPPNASIQVRELDWTVPPNEWSWDHPAAIASPVPRAPPPAHTEPLICPPFDLIVSADTVFSSDLVQPFLRTLHALSILSDPHPPIILCLERRDPLLVDHLLAQAAHPWRFSVQRIPHNKILRTLKKARAQWDKSQWDDLEIWKLRLDKDATT